MAEELAFNQVFRDGGAIYLDEHGVFTQALRVDGERHQLFPRARFAIDEHPPVGGGHQGNLLPQRFQRDALPHQLALGLHLFLKIAVFAAQPSGVNRVLDQDQCLFQRERFFQEVIGAKLGGAHRGLNGAMAGDHDDLGRIVGGAQFLQGFQAIHVRQPYIEKHNFEVVLLQDFQAGLAAARDRGLVAFIFERAFQRFANLLFVVNDQNVMHDRAARPFLRWRRERQPQPAAPQ